MASNFCSGMAWFFLFIIFRILRLNQRDFRDSNESGSFSIFLCILWFLRQARASLLNRILCGQYERYGEDYQWLSELPLYSKTSSVWADWLCQGVLLTLLVWGKKKEKRLKKEQFLSSACVVFVLLRFSFRGEHLSGGFQLPNCSSVGQRSRFGFQRFLPAVCNFVFTLLLQQ